MFKLPEFNFSEATFLTTETIQYHHGRHHKAYLDNLNKLVEGRPHKSIETIICEAEGPLFNNAAQAWNHTFYWMGITPTPVKLKVESPLLMALHEQFGSYEGLTKQFIEKAASVFGSGWAWLAEVREDRRLTILTTSNADVIDFKMYMPLLVCDVWEHAYYIDYRNSRTKYLSDFWGAINWSFVESNFINKDLSAVGDLMEDK